MLLNIILLILGFVLLIKGADFLVAGSTSLGVKFRMPQMVIGLTIVALGTSLPEFFINIIGSISGKNDIVLGNIIGSNIFNILLILGISSIIYPIKAERNTVWKEIPFVIIVSLILFFLSNDSLFGEPSSVISRGDGIILFFFLGFFLFYLFKMANDGKPQEEIISETNMIKIIIFIITGTAGLIIGGNLIVKSAVKFAAFLGVGEKLIAITIISMGTGMPELVTSIVASCRKNSSLALGNIVGSNIFNILLGISTSSIIYPIKLDSNYYIIDFVILLICSFIMFFSMFMVKKSTITRIEGIFYVMLYVFYILYNILFL